MQGKEVMQICSKWFFFSFFCCTVLKVCGCGFFVVVFFSWNFFFFLLLYLGCSGIIVFFKCACKCLFKSKLVGSDFSLTASGM